MQTSDPISTFVPALWPCRLFTTSFSVLTTSMLEFPHQMQHAFAPFNAFVSSSSYHIAALALVLEAKLPSIFLFNGM